VTVTRAAFLALLLLGCACGKKTGAPLPERASAAISTMAIAIPAPASAVVSSAASPSGPRSWTGSYVARVTTLEQPAGPKAAAAADDASKLAVGPGTFSLSAKGSRVTGEGKGSLGALVVSGVLDGRELRAGLTPADPSAPQAMTGWLSVRLDEGFAAGQGTLRVSNGDARLVREAAVAIERSR
jgi:hypothetical protein